MAQRSANIPASEYEPINGQDHEHRLERDKQGHVDETVHEVASESLTREKQNETISATLLRQDAAIWMFSFYAVLAVASWIIICLLTFRPLPHGSYTNVYNANHADFDSAWAYIPSGTFSPDRRQAYVTSRNWYKTAQTLQAIVGLLTLSISAAICSKCAIAFLQKTHHRTTLRQALILSDKGWLNPRNYLFQFNSDRRRLVSTPAFYVFMAVTVIGLAIPPLQQVLITQVTIKAPTNFHDLKNTQTVDITDLLPSVFELQESLANSKLTIMVQETFASSFESRPLFNLWIDSNTSMSCKDTEGSFNQSPLQMLPHISAGPDGCQTYGDRLTQNPPFITQVPAFKNTGLVTQFVPRMNSTVTYVEISASQFPEDCTDKAAGFYAEYSGHSDEANYYSVKACMLERDTQPPWRAVRHRQDIQERLYLQVRACVLGLGCGSSTFQTDANTTLGWFELPNYTNGNQPGPLLQKSPLPCHLGACAVQVDQYSDVYKRVSHDRSESQVKDFVNLASRRNVGPLTLTVLALFGQQSWISSQNTLVNNPGFDPATNGPENTLLDGTCSGSAPLANLGFNVNHMYDSDLGCLPVQYDYAPSRVQVPAEWLLQFLQPDSMQIGLGAAVILASNAWLWYGSSSLTVTSDRGYETIKPRMLPASMIVISALWGIYLVSLASLVYYSFSTRVWTNSLDGFALLRMGAALSDKIFLKIHPLEDEELRILDDLPGWFGDGNPSEEVGQVELGAQDPLRQGRYYTSYAQWLPWVERQSRFNQPRS